MRTSNSDRAARFSKLVGMYQDDDQTNLIDLLADALHWSRQEGVSFSHALGIALMHFAAEENAEVELTQ